MKRFLAECVLDTTQVHTVSLYESSQRYNEVVIDVPEIEAPVVLILAMQTSWELSLVPTRQGPLF